MCWMSVHPVERGQRDIIPHRLCCVFTLFACSLRNKNMKVKTHWCQGKQVLWYRLELRREMNHKALSTFSFFVWERQYNSFKASPFPQNPLALDQLQMRGLLMTLPLSLLLPPGCRIENCESCFSKDFCTKCKSGFYLHKGRCFDKCPEGFAPLEDTMECGGMWSETNM